MAALFRLWTVCPLRVEGLPSVMLWETRERRDAPPDVCPLGRYQDVALGVDDRDHDRIVDSSAWEASSATGLVQSSTRQLTEDGAPDLGDEHRAGRDLEVLPDLEISGEPD